MLSSSTSPMKRPSIPIPQSMHKLIAKLQSTKKSDSKKLIRSLPLQYEHHGHSSKKSKIDKVSKTVELESDESLLISTNSVDSSSGRIEENDNSAADLLVDSFLSTSVSNDERTFTYPEMHDFNGKDGDSTVPKLTNKSFSTSFEKSDDIDFPKCSKQLKSDLKSAIKTVNRPVDRNSTLKKWVTFNDILHDKKRGSFVDELYDEDDNENVSSYQLPTERPVDQIPALTNDEDLQPKSDLYDMRQQVLDAIQQVRRIRDMITKADEEIITLLQNGGVEDTPCGDAVQ